MIRMHHRAVALGIGCGAWPGSTAPGPDMAGADADRATKEPAAGGQVGYALPFRRCEATFSSDGTFREEE